MLFNSVDFAWFLPLVFIVYWLLGEKRLHAQNFWLLLASYFFYGCWDWRFLGLIFFSSVLDYTLGLALARSKSSGKRKSLLALSLSVNLGFLALFKYYDFFLDNFLLAFSFLGWEFERQALGWVLPVGISFYTFQTLSYTIDVYRRQLNPSTDLIAFLAFVSFFPQLVAGPIERATQLLPQFQRPRHFDYSQAVDGLRQILWGLFKKVVIADNCAEYANIVFGNSSALSGSALFLGAFCFAFQIYGDFSGYSDIAIGSARLFGFKLMRNFAFPYFSRDIAEFWRRWHISLSTWFRDYLYIPLGGSQGGIWRRLRNTFIIFLVSGFWHGANWTFIVWGGLNALYFLPLLLKQQNRQYLDVVAKGRFWPNWRELLAMLSTFTLVTLAWVFFRADNLSQALNILGGIFSPSFFSLPYIPEPLTGLPIIPKTLILLVLFFLCVEWWGREEQHPLAKLARSASRPYRWLVYNLLLVLMFVFTGKEQQFIYFQF